MIKSKIKMEFRIAKKSPMFICSLMFILGTVLAVSLFTFPSYETIAEIPIPIPVTFILLATIIMGILILRRYKRNISLLLCVLVLFAGFSYTQILMYNNYPQDKIIAHDAIEGTIVSLNRTSENSIKLILDNITISNENESQEIGSKVNLIVFGQSGSFLQNEFYMQNSVIRIKSQLEYPARSQEYGFYDERIDLLSSNSAYKALAHYGAISIVESNEPGSFSSFIRKYQKQLFGRIDRLISGDEAHLIKALLTGQKDGLSYEIRSAFSDLGISHLLATSGLHIGILLLAFELLAKRIRMPIVPRAIISAILILMFMLLAGFRISIVRAALMWAMLIASRMMGTKYNGINSLGAAMFAMVITNPLCIYDISFILSCVSVFGIALFYSPIANLFGKNKKNNNNKLIAILATTVAIVVFAWPITAYYFNNIPILSPFFNVIFVPIMSILLLISLLFSVLSGVSFIAPILATIARLHGFVVIEFSQILRPFSLNILSISPPLIVIILWMLGMILLSSILKKKKSKYKLVVSLSLIAVSLVIVIFSFIDTSRQSQMKAYSDSSDSVIYIQQDKQNALILNNDSYITQSVLRKTATKKLNVLIFSGNDLQDLDTILTQLNGYEIDTVYISDMLSLEDVNMPSNDIIQSSSIDFHNYHIELLPFKATSKKAQIHFAVKIEGGDVEVLYLDPLSLRADAFGKEHYDTVVSSRWSKARIKHLGNISCDNLIINDSKYLFSDSIAELEHQGCKIYNINYIGAISLLEGK